MPDQPLLASERGGLIETLWTRYRHVTVLCALLVFQLSLIAYQLQAKKEIPLLREGAVTAVTPFAKFVNFFRMNTVGFLDDYVRLTQVKEENRRLANDNARLKLENQNLRIQLSTADRVKALQAYQAQVPSKTLVASVIGSSTNLSAQVVYVNRGTVHGVKAGMPVITEDGIVGKVVKVFPTDAQILLITDQGFSAAVVLDKVKLHGILRGRGQNNPARIDVVQTELPVKKGDIFYTSGNDRVFPKGLPVGKVIDVKEAGGDKQISVAPFINQTTMDEVLIVVEGVHGPIPETAKPSSEIYIGPTPAADMINSGNAIPDSNSGVPRTDADRLFDRYRAVGPGGGYVPNAAGNGAGGNGAGRNGTGGNSGAPQSTQPKPSVKPGESPADSTTKPAPKPDTVVTPPSEALPPNGNGAAPVVSSGSSPNATSNSTPNSGAGNVVPAKKSVTEAPKAPAPKTKTSGAAYQPPKILNGTDNQ
jgi:rod shape-determining protein MreC